MKQLMERYNILQFIGVSQLNSRFFTFIFFPNFKKEIIRRSQAVQTTIAKHRKREIQKGNFIVLTAPDRSHRRETRVGNSSQKLRTIRDETGVVERNEPSSSAADPHEKEHPASMRGREFGRA